MKQELFTKPLSSVLSPLLQHGKLEVQQIDTDSLPAALLAEHIETIAGRYLPTVAKIDKSMISATRGTTEVIAEDEDGPLGSVMERVLKVNIPFFGDENSFRVAPTGGSKVCADCEIGKNVISLSVDDDENARAKVTSFVRQVSVNLEALRYEVEELKPFVRIMLQKAASRKRPEVSVPEGPELDFPIED